MQKIIWFNPLDVIQDRCHPERSRRLFYMERASTKFILSENERTQPENDFWMYEDVLLKFILLYLFVFIIVNVIIV